MLSAGAAGITDMARTIGIFIFPGFQMLDLAGPLAAFQSAGRMSASNGYDIWAVSQHGDLVRSSVGVDVMTMPVDQFTFDTLIFAGGRCVPPEPVGDVAEIVIRHAQSARRIASVCTGAFILAAAGLLDERQATTHWRYAATLQRLFPRIRVDGDRIFVKSGSVWTSAGISAGIDLSLALIEDDLGREVSRAVARDLVVYHRRPGGQSQFSALLDIEPSSDRIRAALSYAREHLDETLSVERLAGVACLSPRQFGRSFLLETGETPAKAVERLRAEAARARIEDSNEPIELIAKQVGFADPERMRRAFVRIFGHPPQNLRRQARAVTGLAANFAG